MSRNREQEVNRMKFDLRSHPDADSALYSPRSDRVSVDASGYISGHTDLDNILYSGIEI